MEEAKKVVNKILGKDIYSENEEETINTEDGDEFGTDEEY
jgi:hypothetical protein